MFPIAAFYPTATYRRTLDGSLRLSPDGGRPVPWTTVDPTSLSSSSTASGDEPSPLRPMTITVIEGEWLYLPAHWWHYVQQAEGDEGICVAVNQ